MTNEIVHFPPSPFGHLLDCDFVIMQEQISTSRLIFRSTHFYVTNIMYIYVCVCMCLCVCVVRYRNAYYIAMC